MGGEDEELGEEENDVVHLFLWFQLLVCWVGVLNFGLIYIGREELIHFAWCMLLFS